jgi:hypothetical protein
MALTTQILFLNYYAKKHNELEEEAKEPEIPATQIQAISNEGVISSIIDVSNATERVGFGSTPKISRRN